MLTSPGHSFLNSLLTVHKLSYSLHGSVRYSSIFSSPSGLLYNLGKITFRPCATDLPSSCQFGLVSNPPLAKSVETMNSGVGQLRTSMCSLTVIYNINSFLRELFSQTSSWTFDHVFCSNSTSTNTQNNFSKIGQPNYIPSSPAAKREWMFIFPSYLFISIPPSHYPQCTWTSLPLDFAVAGA